MAYKKEIKFPRPKFSYLTLNIILTLMVLFFAVSNYALHQGVGYVDVAATIIALEKVIILVILVDLLFYVGDIIYYVYTKIKKFINK